MNLLGLTFASPLILFGLLALPLIWWLLRLTPPRPKEEVFPPTRILEEIGKREETPAQSPWWLTLLRLLMAALIIFALSEPVWNAQTKSLQGNGPVLIVMDNGWASGPGWSERMITAEELLEQAADAGRPTALVFSTDGAKADLNTTLAEQLLPKLKAAEPLPLPVDMAALADRVASAPVPFSSLVWLTSGLGHPGTEKFAEAVNVLNIPQALVYQPDTDGLQVLTGINNTPEALVANVERPNLNVAQQGRATEFDQQGRSIASADFSFAVDQTASDVRFVLPVELRNEITRIAIDDHQQAGGVQL
ncbi:MAG: BatA domain-containing protein, partial [Pseudomonadota bacterium]